MTLRLDVTLATADARRSLDQLCDKLGIERDPIRPPPRTLWQRFKAWLFDKPLRYPWLLRVETWLLERLGRRPRTCVLVARKLDDLAASVRHEVEDLTKRADAALADDARYLGFCGQSTPKGVPVEVRLDDGSRVTMEVEDVGVDQVRVRDFVSGELETHPWFNVRRIRRAGDDPDIKVPSPTWDDAGDLVPALEPGQKRKDIAPPPPNVHRHDGVVPKKGTDR